MPNESDPTKHSKLAATPEPRTYSDDDGTFPWGFEDGGYVMPHEWTTGGMITDRRIIEDIFKCRDATLPPFGSPNRERLDYRQGAAAVAVNNIEITLRREYEERASEQREAEKQAKAQSNMAELVEVIEDAIGRTKDDEPGALFESQVLQALYKVRTSNMPKYIEIRKRIMAKCKGTVPIGMLEASIDEIADAAPKVESVIATSSSFVSAVERLNKRYTHVLIGGQARIAKKCDDGIYEFLRIDAFHSHFANDRIDVFVNGQQKSVPVSDIWMKAEPRETRIGVKFAPGGAPDDVLNLWTKFTVTPVMSKTLFQAGLRCRRFLSHLKYNVCQGNRGNFRYLIRWIAHMFQKPEEKPGVAISIVGKRGVGKTKVAQAIGALLGQHGVTVSEQRHLTGNFNAHLAQALFVSSEEAFWAGDKRAEGSLKHMVTGDTMPLEKKGIDVVTIDSYLRVMFTANPPGWTFPAAADERRLFALECGSERMKDYAYFKAIDDQLFGEDKRRYVPGQDKEPPGLRALLTFFMKLDLTGFNVREAPETDALKDQRLASLEPHEQFILDCLENHTIGQQIASDGWSYEPAPWPPDSVSYIKKTSLYEAFINSPAARGKQRLIAGNMFGNFIMNDLGWRTFREQNNTGGSEKGLAYGYYWVVPEYSRARLEFIEKMKVRINNA